MNTAKQLSNTRDTIEKYLKSFLLVQNFKIALKTKCFI